MCPQSALCANKNGTARARGSKTICAPKCPVHLRMSRAPLPNHLHDRTNGVSQATSVNCPLDSRILGFHGARAGGKLRAT
jgi:hypothetical protein